MDGLVISGSEFREQLESQGLKSNRTGETKSSQRDLHIPNPGDTGFAQTLKDAVMDVNRMQMESDLQMQKLATGKTQNVHETMIKAEKADIALRLMIQVRNKLIDAYQEIMKMQV